MDEPKRLDLEAEWLLDRLLDPPDDGRFEASGVVARGRDLFVVFDNTRRVARLPQNLERGGGSWIDLPGRADGFEDIAFEERSRRFFLLVEGMRKGGRYLSAIDEYDESWRMRRRLPIGVGIKARNKGFEALAWLPAAGAGRLLALPEEADDPAVLVLQRGRDAWKVSTTMPLPAAAAELRDYSAIAVRGTRIAVLSQEDSRLWVGRFDSATWRIKGEGRVIDFPRSRKGKRQYCNLEGMAWLAADRLVLVSDRAKRKSQPKRCRRRAESIHIFRLR